MGLMRSGVPGWTWLRRVLQSPPRIEPPAQEATPAQAWIGNWASLISVQPTIIGSWPSHILPLGAASLIGPRLGDHPIEFLLMPLWAWESWEAENILAAVQAHVHRHPRHRFSFLCNTPVQEGRFAESGWPVVTLNWNMFIDELAFCPLPDVVPIYDAIYNARLSADKRPELAADIERLCLLYYYFESPEMTVAQFHGEHGRLKARMPNATFLNRLTAEGCEFLLPPDVNRAMNSARVGLCLSAIEGQMRASMEYMMAGLPIVSTPSIGGRDYFFDEEYCAVVEADPRQIRDAVGAMIARNIPREYVRAKTMSRIEHERARFIAFVQNVIDRHGGRADFGAVFAQLLRRNRLVPWFPSLSEFARIVDDALLTGKLFAD
jgi:glycosyl transferase family 1